MELQFGKTLTGCNINEDQVANPDLRIQCCGIRIGDHARWNIVEDDDRYNTDNNISLLYTEIGFCGIHGLYARNSEGDHDISSTYSNSNGWRDDLDDWVGGGLRGFFPSERGCGIFFDNWQDGYVGTNVEGTIDITNNSKTNSNTWDGIRMDDMSAVVLIEETIIDQNTGSGIWYDFSGHPEELTVTECTISSNDWDGIFVSHNGPNPTDVEITQNIIDNNQQDTGDQWNFEWGLALDIAGIRLYGSIIGLGGDPILIQHNFINEGNNGITLENNNLGAMPTLVDIKNNVILNTGEDEDEFAGIKLLEFTNPGDIVNNSICGYDEGLIISANCPNQAAGVITWIYNNIFAECAIGIDDNNDDGANPTIDYNGFSNNDTDTEGVTEGANNEVTGGGDFSSIANDDLHLLYTSPMINVGDPAAAYDDPDGSDNDLGAFGGPDADFGMEDFEDYVTIPADEDVADATVLIYDTYGLFPDCTVLNGRTLTIVRLQKKLDRFFKN